MDILKLLGNFKMSIHKKGEEIMPARKKTPPSVGGDMIQATIGSHASQVAVGKDIHQQQVNSSGAVTEADLKQFQALFEELKQQISSQAPPDKKDAALERVDELKQELASPKPQLSTLEYVRNWFGKNLPGLLGGVTSLIINPIVGKVVEAASGLAADALRKQFGGK
jgi:hypothetical protein